MRVAVGMSGGVDSSTAALILKEEGHDVVGLTALLRDCAQALSGLSGERAERPCCGSPESLRRAREAADAIGVPHEVVDLSEEFEREVVAPTVRAYAEARTPNPCVLCNERVRFPYLVEAARARGAGALATGHYARLVPRDEAGAGGEGEGERDVRLLRGRDRSHDQSYFLFAVAPELLAFSRFPLGSMTKSGTRERARAAGHPAAGRRSSQDLCFAGGRSLAALVRERVPGAARAGRIVDTSGRVLGRHGGLVGYTVGQRKGIGIASGGPLYVVELRPETNELVVGSGAELGCSRFELEDLRPLPPTPGLRPGGLMSRRPKGRRWGLAPGPGPGGEIEAFVQVRYRTPAVRSRVRITGDGRAEVVLAEPVRAVAPGQCAVFYAPPPDPGDAGAADRAGEVVGGGWIARRS